MGLYQQNEGFVVLGCEASACGVFVQWGRAVASLELEVAAGAAGTGGREYSLQSAVTVAHLNKKKATDGSATGGSSSCWVWTAGIRRLTCGPWLPVHKGSSLRAETNTFQWHSSLRADGNVGAVALHVRPWGLMLACSVS